MHKNFLKKLFKVAIWYILFKVFIYFANMLLSPLVNIVSMGVLVFLLYAVPGLIIFMIFYRRRVDDQTGRIEYRKVMIDDTSLFTGSEWDYIMNVHGVKTDLLAFALLGIYYIPFVYLRGIDYIDVWIFIDAVISFTIFWLILSAADFVMWLLVHRRWEKYMNF